ncbi:hypothetical protein [Perlabentimonas gracilis]|uniref:hypothetical protein n=1 Tax=Perlabentimonas gracilis TaxID=2715279 RepID=UPI00140C95D4|nr:hypothetical protein [Perlabentimonas gracilis]NHB70172.1 hypothetical protein [Perlabentimonas gracilis]
MKTTMKQTEQELNGNLNKFANLALTDREMVKLFGGTSTSTDTNTNSGSETSSSTNSTPFGTGTGSDGNNDNPPPIVKED